MNHDQKLEETAEEEKSPSPPSEELKPKKKSRKLLKLLIILIIIVLIPVLFVGATGLYNIPVISQIFNVNQPKDLGIKTSQESLDNLAKKIPLKLNGEPSEYRLTGNRKFSGQIKVETKTTSEEITSFLNKYLQNDDLTDGGIQVKMIEGGLELSSKLKKPLSAPVYAKVLVTRTSANSVDLELQQGKIGIFSVPSNYLEQAEEWFEKTINKRMTEVPGFSMEKLEYHDGYSNFKGTFPAEVSPAPGNWVQI